MQPDAGTTPDAGSSSADAGTSIDAGQFKVYSLYCPQCFSFSTASVDGGGSCDVLAQSCEGSLWGTGGNANNLCDQSMNAGNPSIQYNSPLAIPGTCLNSWTSYIEGGGDTLVNYGVLVQGGDPLPDGGVAYYRMRVLNDANQQSPGVMLIQFQFAPL